MSRPAYNHTRGDSPRTPCPLCKAETKKELQHVILDTMLKCALIAFAIAIYYLAYKLMNGGRPLDETIITAFCSVFYPAAIVIIKGWRDELDA